MCSGRETPGKSIASSSGKIGITAGSLSAPGAFSGGADCARTVPPANKRLTIPIAHASLLDCICSPFGHAASDALAAYTKIATALCRYDDVKPLELWAVPPGPHPCKIPSLTRSKARRTYEPTLRLSDGCGPR